MSRDAWQLIRAEYEMGLAPVAEIARRWQVSPQALYAHAAREGWIGRRKQRATTAGSTHTASATTTHADSGTATTAVPSQRADSSTHAATTEAPSTRDASATDEAPTEALVQRADSVKDEATAETTTTDETMAADVASPIQTPANVGRARVHGLPDRATCLSQIAQGRTLAQIAQAASTTPGEVWAYLIPDRYARAEYDAARAIYADTLISSAHDLIDRAIAGEDIPPKALDLKVRLSQWHAGKLSQEYADRSSVQVSAEVSVAHRADTDLAAQLAALVEAARYPSGAVIDARPSNPALPSTLPD